MTIYIVSSGVVSSGLTLGAGDVLTVLAGGAAAAITDGGEELVSSGGVASGTLVVGGGHLWVAAGSVVGAVMVSSGAILSGPGTVIGYQNVIEGVAEGLSKGAEFRGGLTRDAVSRNSIDGERRP